MKSKKAKHGHTILAYVVLILLSFLCLFFFYILIVNATRSHAYLQKGFSAIPGTYFLENLKNVANDGSFPMFKGILNSHLESRNYGMAGALSVYLFIVSGILCFFVYRMTNGNNDDGYGSKASKRKLKDARKGRR